MASLRERLRKHTAICPEANMKDTGHEVFPKLSSLTMDRYVIADKLRAKRYALRRRLALGLDRVKTDQVSQHAEHDRSSSDSQDKHSSSIRRGINSISSSLRQRLSSDTSTGSDSQALSHRSSIIRKSFSSVSSSLRGIRSSMSSSRPSQDATTLCNTPPDDTVRLAKHFSHRRCNSLDHVSSTSSGKDSTPRLPDLDTTIKGIERSTENRSPNTLFSMSIFDRLDGPFAADSNDKVDTKWEEIVVPRQPSPISGRFPIRIKRLDSTVGERVVEPRISQEDTLTSIDDQDPTNCSALRNGDLRGAHTDSKLPTQWLDCILETSVAIRDKGFLIYKSISDDKIKERLRRLYARVYVFVPDKYDNSKPWPRHRYPDLESALKDLCTRFKPYYASFAAFAPNAHAIQLFPPDFKSLDNEGLASGIIIFNIQEAMDNWHAASSDVGRRRPKEEMKELIADAKSEMNFSIVTEDLAALEGHSPPCVYDADSMEMDASLDDIREPVISGFTEHKMKSSETLLTDDYDMTIASKMGFIP
ncbi:hypothetical protein F5Y11DRAFT_345836 [Daldinia sp. FL1419]|nr:hypothetical protein F5Y11DRAFT_345836 [Daldinia sp. FL1419]